MTGADEPEALSPAVRALLARRPELLTLYGSEVDEAALVADFGALPPGDLPHLMRHIQSCRDAQIALAQKNRGQA